MKYYLGIDIGGTNLAVGLVDEHGRILHSDSMPARVPRPAEELCHDTALVCRKVLADYGITMEQVAAIGAGCPGLIHDGYVVAATNLVLRNAPVAALLEQELDRSVTLCNDADAAAYGEFTVSWDQKPDPFVAITLGTGVGGSIIIDGKIRAGFNGSGGEIGHTVIRAGGRKCPCGRTGCFERYCSGSSLERDTRAAMARNKESLMWELAGSAKNATAKTLFRAVEQGDPAAQRVLDYYVENLAVGVQNLIKLLQPEVLCIGGGVSYAGDALLRPLTEKLNGMVRRRNTLPVTMVTLARLKGEAGIIGAAMWGRRQQEGV